MANSKYEYVRSFEQSDTLLANTWIVVRIDGRGFSKFTTKYKFVKPNDRAAMDLMNTSAEAVMKELPDLVLAYGNSDEFSFVFHKDCVLFERRASKLTTTVVSTFTSYYVFLWSKYFPDKPLTPPLPSFDGRAVCYPGDSNLRDYMSWRQVDCHINNLYNTTFWTLVQKGGMGAQEAEQRLSGTVSSDKNEILFKEFGINYNNEPECFKKGTVLYRDFFPTPPKATSPTLKMFASTPIASPQPKRFTELSRSQLIVKADPDLEDQMVSPVDQGPRPTFLSTTSTPSPSPSPAMTAKAAFPNPLRSNPMSSHSSTPPPTSMMLSLSPSTVTSPHRNVTSPHGKQGLPLLTPIPLSALTLKPSIKPPLSLNPPNPTTRTNFSPTSPTHEFPCDFTVAGYRHQIASGIARPISHSASASLNDAESTQSRAPRIKQRSPSQPLLPTYLDSGTKSSGGPPVIPLRISSIPTNNQTRKLSLSNDRSTSTLKPKRQISEEKELITSVVSSVGFMTTRNVSPPLQTNKALPSPPMGWEEGLRTREKAKGPNTQEEWGMPTTVNTHGPLQRWISDPDKRGDHIDIAELRTVASTSTKRPESPSRLYSTPVSSSLYSPRQGSNAQAISLIAAPSKSNSLSTQPLLNTDEITATELDIQATSPMENSQCSNAVQTLTESKTSTAKADAQRRAKKCNERTLQPHTNGARQNKGKGNIVERSGRASGTYQQSNGGRPVQMSRTQKDKDRKKRIKAKVLIEHVDIIKDEFWEKRPWILNGKTG